jgi:adenosylmethionine-8-amino-7-oxononanoate aminotransferase
MGARKWSESELSALEKDALGLIIPHFASNESLAKKPRIFTRGEGCYLWDVEGNRYFDTFASLLTTIYGHCHPKIVAAMREQLSLLEFFPNYEDAFTIPLVELARKLAQIAPADLSVTFFINSGSEANETAIKMARQYHLERGQPHRFKVIARKYSYHGTTLGGISATGLPWFRTYFEPLLPGCIFAPQVRVDDSASKCLEEMEELIEYEGPESISSMIMDPIPGSNTGYPLPPDGYLQGIRDLCDKHGILLIFDEVQTGFGKTGKWFACEHWDMAPDILTIGKGFSGGYAPIAAAITTPKIASEFTKGPGHEFRSGSTFGGHTLACTAALACIDLIEEENLLEKVSEFSLYIKENLEKMYRYPIVGDVRGIGLLWAVELMADRESKAKIDPKLGVGHWINQWCFERGMILRNNGEILVLAPALTITKEEVDMVLDMMNQAIGAAVEHFGF